MDSQLTELRLVGGDRIVRLGFRKPGQAPCALVAELTGRHGNLILCAGADRVQAVLVPPPANKQDPRLVVGEPWAPPPGRALSRAPGEPRLAELLPEPDEPDESGETGKRAGAAAVAPLSWRVEHHLGQAESGQFTERRRKRLAERTRRRLKKAAGLRRGLEQKKLSAEDAERVLRDGELLKAHSHELGRGLQCAVVADWFEEGSPERTIPLDPRLSALDNAEKFFARYKKLVRAGANVDEELERVHEREARLAELLERIAAPELDAEGLAQLAEEAVAAGLLEPEQEADPRKRKPSEPRRPYRRFAGLAGSEIRVGRSARDNDQLTFRGANGNDLWLHTADAPGSHVILKLAKNAEPDSEELLDAAHLAIHFSPLREARKADVHVALRKFVHKPRGAKPGLVTLSGGRRMTVRVQPQRLERLLRTS